MGITCFDQGTRPFDVALPLSRQVRHPRSQHTYADCERDLRGLVLARVTAVAALQQLLAKLKGLVLASAGSRCLFRFAKTDTLSLSKTKGTYQSSKQVKSRPVKIPRTVVHANQRLHAYAVG